VVKKLKFTRLYVKARKGNESSLYVYKDAVPGKLPKQLYTPEMPENGASPGLVPGGGIGG
jgi:hypothetical protein